MSAEKTINIESDVIIGALVRTLSDLIDHSIQGNESEYRPVRRLLAMLAVEPRRPAPEAPRELPAVRFWDAELNALRIGSGSALAPLLQQLTPRLHWWQDEHYTVANVGADFMKNYAQTELVGTRGLCHSHTLSLGVLLMGPDTFYPAHRHPAEEGLYVLSGRGTWHLDKGPTISLPPGGVVYIPAEGAHAFWSFEAPMVAVYFCHGDVGKNSRLCEPSEKTIGWPKPMLAP